MLACLHSMRVKTLRSSPHDFSKDALELMIAGHYDHSLTLHMLEIFLLAGGDGIGGVEFRHPLRNLKDELDAGLVAVTFKDKSAAGLVGSVKIGIASVSSAIFMSALYLYVLPTYLQTSLMVLVNMSAACRKLA